MPDSSTSLSYPKRPVLQNIIVLPFDPDSYQSLILSAQSFRSFLQHQFLDSPELFPPSFAQGFQMKDIYFSKKLELYFRRILIDSITYQVRPSFVTPYFTALTDEVSHALFLRKFAVPYWALTHVFGRNDMFWYRLDSSLGRHSLVSTTVKSPQHLPQHLCADEKIAYFHGNSLPVAMTVAQNCVLGIEPSLSLEEKDLEKAYGVFQREAKEVEASYTPETVNLDGWKASMNVWKKLYPLICLIPCFLHVYLKLRKAATKQMNQQYEVICSKLEKIKQKKRLQGNVALIA
jgi:hypothetical protein